MASSDQIKDTNSGQEVAIEQILQELSFEEIDRTLAILHEDRVLHNILLHSVYLAQSNRNLELIGTPKSTIGSRDCRLIQREALRGIHSADMWSNSFGTSRLFRQLFTLSNLEKMVELDLIKIVDHTDNTWSSFLLLEKGWLLIHFSDLTNISNCDCKKIVRAIFLDNIGDTRYFQENPGLIQVPSAIMKRLRRHIPFRTKKEGGSIFPILGSTGSGKSTLISFLGRYLRSHSFGKSKKPVKLVEIDWSFEDIKNPLDVMYRSLHPVVEDFNELFQSGNNHIVISFLNFERVITTYLSSHNPQILEFFNRFLFRLNSSKQAKAIILMELEGIESLTSLMLSEFPDEPPFLAPALVTTDVSMQDMKDIVFEAFFTKMLPYLSNHYNRNFLLSEFLNSLNELVVHLDRLKLSTFQKLYLLKYYISSIEPLLQANSRTVGIIDHVDDFFSRLEIQGEGLVDTLLFDEFERLNFDIPLYQLLRTIQNASEVGDFCWNSAMIVENPLPADAKIFLIAHNGLVLFRHQSILDSFIEWQESELITKEEEKLIHLIDRAELVLLLAEDIGYFVEYPLDLVKSFERVQLEVYAAYKRWERFPDPERILDNDKLEQYISVLLLSGKEIELRLQDIEELDFSPHLLRFFNLVNQSDPYNVWLKQYGLNLVSQLKRYPKLRQKCSSIPYFLRKLPNQFILDLLPQMLEQAWLLEGGLDELSRYLAINLAELQEVMEEEVNKFFEIRKRFVAYKGSQYESFRKLWYTTALNFLSHSGDHALLDNVVANLLLESVYFKTELVKHLDGSPFVKLVIKKWKLHELRVNTKWLRNYPELYYTPMFLHINGEINIHDISSPESYVRSLLKGDYDLINLQSSNTLFAIPGQGIADDAVNIALFVNALIFMLLFSMDVNTILFDDERIFDKLLDHLRNDVHGRTRNPVFTTSISSVIAFVLEQDSRFSDNYFKWILNLIKNIFESRNIERFPHYLIPLFSNIKATRSTLQKFSEFVQESPKDDYYCNVVIISVLSTLMRDFPTSYTLGKELIDVLRMERSTKAILFELHVIWMHLMGKVTEEFLDLSRSLSQFSIKWVDLCLMANLVTSDKDLDRMSRWSKENNLPIFGETFEFVRGLLQWKSQPELLLHNSPLPYDLSEAYLSIILAVLFIENKGFHKLVKVDMQRLMEWLSLFDVTRGEQTGIPALTVPYAYAILETYWWANSKPEERQHSLINATFLLNHSLTSWVIDLPPDLILGADDEVFNKLTFFRYTEFILNYRLTIQNYINQATDEDAITFAKFILSHQNFALELYAPIVVTLHQKFHHIELVQRCYKLLTIQYISFID